MSDINTKYSRRDFLAYDSIIDAGTTADQAAEAVTTAAIEHADWDLDEKLTWAEWERQRPKGRRSS